jgi:hypothetical protein
MPISKKQLIANRQNAQKSTGPKTAHGKAVISRNAFKHGLYADDIIIDSPYLKENKVEYDLLLSSLIDELKPIGRFQEYLVCKIANCLWRSRRAIIAETAQINRQLKNVNADLRLDSILNRLRNRPDDTPETPETPEDESQALSNLVGIRSIPNESFSFNLLRYEMRLDRQMTRAYRLLKHLQYQRHAESLQNRYNEK